MPASTSETAEIVGSSTSVDSTFSERMAFIGSSPVSRVYRARIPPHDESKTTASVLPILTASRPICGNARSFPGRDRSGGETSAHQLCLNPAVRLLLVVPSGVSPTEAEMLTPSYNFCSAPTLRSHLSSAEDSVWPAIRLVPVPPMLSFADCSV